MVAQFPRLSISITSPLLCHCHHYHRLAVGPAGSISIVPPHSMASSYSIEDQAADLGIHRIHSLVLGDARREARIAARLSPHTPKRGVLGRGDSKHEDQDYESLQKHELSRIARRQNLMRYPCQMKPSHKQVTFVILGFWFPCDG